MSKKNYQPKTYRLKGDFSPLSFLLKTGRGNNLLCFDEAKGYNRAIRHCPNERSIYVDEQSEYAVIKVVEFERGYLEVGATDTITKEFLDKNPYNGTIFEEVNFEEEAKEDIEIQDVIADLRIAVREKAKEENGIYELEALVAVLKGSVTEASNMSSSELKREIYQTINNDPLRFVDENGNLRLFDEYIKRRHIGLTALDTGVLEISANQRAIVWGKSKETLINIPKGILPIDSLSDYFETNDGILALEEIANRS